MHLSFNVRKMAMCPLRPGVNGELERSGQSSCIAICTQWRCPCQRLFPARSEALQCFNRHAVRLAEDALRDSMHELTDGPGGVWLATGEQCPACESLDGGWCCGGESQQLCNCFQCTPLVAGVVVFETLAGGRFCVHGKQGEGRAVRGELERVIAHLEHHRRYAVDAAKHVDRMRLGFVYSNQ